MKITIKLFAGARQFAGAETVEVELADGATIGDLRRALCEMYPDARAIVAHAMFAQEMDYVADASPILPGAEIACIPPVSGG